MTDPIARLQKLDQRRTILHNYSRKIRLARLVAPALEARMQRRIDARFLEYTRERRQLLELIKANPVLRERLFSLETSALKAAGISKQTGHAPPKEKEQDR